MANITLVQQAEKSPANELSCSLTLNNCTVGNTLIVAFALRGQGNTATLSNGWEILGGGNVVVLPSVSYQCVYFAKKKVTSEIETITITQDSSVASGTMRICAVIGEFSGDFDVVMRNDMANYGSSYYNVNATKSNETDVIIYATSSAYYQGSAGRQQTATPNDLEKLQGDSAEERLTCWFDNGTGAISHTFTTCSGGDSSSDVIVECVQLIPKKPKYLIRNNDIIYTVQNDSLVEVVGDLNAQLFIDNGVDDIPSGSLLIGLSNPEVLCWKDSDIVPTLKATVQGTPIGEHDVISDDIRIGHESIFGITSVEATASDGATFSLSFDNGAYMVYDTSSSAWVASDVGMSATELVAIPTDAWSSVVNSATTMRLKATIDGIETVSKVKFNFDNTSPINLESEVE